MKTDPFISSIVRSTLTERPQGSAVCANCAHWLSFNQGSVGSCTKMVPDLTDGNDGTRPTWSCDVHSPKSIPSSPLPLLPTSASPAFAYQKPGLGNDALATRWSEAGDTYLEAVEAAD